jgi:hypothetical protein
MRWAGARSTYDGEEKCIRGFGGEGDRLEDRGIDGNIILGGSTGSGMGRH